MFYSGIITGMQPLQPDALPNRRTPKPAVAPAVAQAPESTFNFEKQRLEKLADKYEHQDFPTRLGVDMTATPEEARAALRQKTKEFHPDNKPDELKPSFNRIFALLTEAANAYTGGNIKKPRVETKPTPMEEFKKVFRMNRTFDTPLGKSASETFNLLKVAYIKAGKITEEEANELRATLVDKVA